MGRQCTRHRFRLRSNMFNIFSKLFNFQFKKIRILRHRRKALNGSSGYDEKKDVVKSRTMGAVQEKVRETVCRRAYSLYTGSAWPGALDCRIGLGDLKNNLRYGESNPGLHGESVM